MVRAPIRSETLKEPSVAAGVLVAEAISFGATLERLLEVLLVVLVGVAVAGAWRWEAVIVAAALFFVVRPIAVHLFLAGSPTTMAQRWLMGWFGIRGIGSVYYLAYAVQHGVEGEAAQFLASMTVSVIALSIILHGASAQPILDRYQQRLARR
jgi:NhaP-type Na+/H+ or K+/H+ antiporter